jgi:hypothetical protein
VNLDDAATTLALLKLDAVVGVKGLFMGAGSASLRGRQNAAHGLKQVVQAEGLAQAHDG